MTIMPEITDDQRAAIRRIKRRWVDTNALVGGDVQILLNIINSLETPSGYVVVPAETANGALEVVGLHLMLASARHATDDIEKYGRIKESLVAALASQKGDKPDV